MSNHTFIGSVFYIVIGRTSPSNKKRSFGEPYCYARTNDRYTFPEPVLSLEGCFYVLIENGCTVADIKTISGGKRSLLLQGTAVSTSSKQKLSLLTQDELGDILFFEYKP